MENKTEIIYEDRDIIVLNKPAGILSEGSEKNGEKTVFDEAKAITGGDVFIVHRLDRLTSGVILLAKNQRAASEMSAFFADKVIQKTYFAVVHGSAPERGECEDYLFFDRQRDKSFVVKKDRRSAKRAHLTFEKTGEKVLQTGEAVSLLKIRPTTGRSHQIRVQLANMGYSLLGDGKYGSKYNKCTVALHSYLLSFDSPDMLKVCREFSEKLSCNPEIISAFPEPDIHPWELFFK